MNWYFSNAGGELAFVSIIFLSHAKFDSEVICPKFYVLW